MTLEQHSSVKCNLERFSYVPRRKKFARKNTSQYDSTCSIDQSYVSSTSDSEGFIPESNSSITSSDLAVNVLAKRKFKNTRICTRRARIVSDDEERCGLPDTIPARCNHTGNNHTGSSGGGNERLLNANSDSTEASEEDQWRVCSDARKLADIEILRRSFPNYSTTDLKRMLIEADWNACAVRQHICQHADTQRLTSATLATSGGQPTTRDSHRQAGDTVFTTSSGTDSDAHVSIERIKSRARLNFRRNRRCALSGSGRVGLHVTSRSEVTCAVVRDNEPKANQNNFHTSHKDADSEGSRVYFMGTPKRRVNGRRVFRIVDEDGTSSDSDKENVSVLPSFANDGNVIQGLIDRLVIEFPSIDIMELQDTILSHGTCIDTLRRVLSQKHSQSVVPTARHTASNFGSDDLFSTNNRFISYRRRVVLNNESDGSDTEDDGVGDNVGDSTTSIAGITDIDDVYRGCDNKEAVVRFLNNASVDDLVLIPGFSLKKAEFLLTLRPFGSWKLLKQTVCNNNKTVNSGLLDKLVTFIQLQRSFDSILNRCGRVSLRMQARVHALLRKSEDDTELAIKQPASLRDNLKLSRYQLIGLNWLILMHNESLNAVLADEMGLGKTIQAIAFLTYLYEIDPTNRFLIVVPSSTMDNWLNELEKWSPCLQVLAYRGSMQERREIRMAHETGEDDQWNVILTTYTTLSSRPDDRKWLHRCRLEYIVFDEAHMLKNALSKRYNTLTKIPTQHRLLLTGTPLQNNLTELASVLMFVVPQAFLAEVNLTKIFEAFQQVHNLSRTKQLNTYQCDRIEKTKQIIHPFFLRRRKCDVIRDLPEKVETVIRVKMCPHQMALYRKFERCISASKHSVCDQDLDEDIKNSGASILMSLRKASNHPLLLRSIYDDKALQPIVSDFMKLPENRDNDAECVMADLQVLNDFEIHEICKKHKCLNTYCLDLSVQLLRCAKMRQLEQLLARFHAHNDRVLVFSQFFIMLDVIEAFLRMRDYTYSRLDGSTEVCVRQQLVDDFNATSDNAPFIFLLSTRAGGLGINLTSANKVILYDLDYNPHNDKQAEDRCHRIGQTRTVEVVKLITEHTVDECMLEVASRKLQLDRQMNADSSRSCVAEVLRLLQTRESQVP